MDDLTRKNMANVVLSSIALFVLNFLGVTALMFWLGGLLVLPGVAFVLQYRYAVGSYFLRMLVAVFPWLFFLGYGWYRASHVVHDGTKGMNLLVLEMCISSLVIAGVAIVIFELFGKYKSRN
ncbi:hypothetical protein U5884_004760 [Vibrio parahaemolyticus]|uniref:hypothetical protein n=1 Tax=Vibrio parahaemolyticus TaxID=670 RepID=UPI0006A64CD2|nr:hypothetical protein [Vibrio parahaemolyticus]EHD6031649.1 hypothetical protein [Vibrio parahaemolyticus]EID7758593.1 hypothetical protein [Vibrio parahaemolyticus]EJR0958136.1 hypothetical protein [Vibrio parahaemolyticus]EKY4210518.1 hypothetical protein [Vibrio parahaemolyticus]EMA9662624.1 hypothetical protein [Vibrio parahaemolyticus]